MQLNTSLLQPGQPLPSCDQRIAALYDYWLSVRPGGGLLPGRQHFDPVAVPQLLSWIWLLDVHEGPHRFKYRLIGTAHVAVIGYDQTGEWIDERYPHVLQAPVYQHFLATADGGLVSYNRGQPTFNLPKAFVSTERLFLPLARDGRKVDMLLGMTVYHPVRPVQESAAVRFDPPLRAIGSR